ncbi:MAG: LamG domain-containing protein [Candidatus Diapherotrites archaeon]|nr:LamG domain-containing protein [Candidatus Diapherotrites archaeon]
MPLEPVRTLLMPPTDKVVSFDGVDDYVRVDDELITQIIDSGCNYTIEVFMLPRCIANRPIAVGWTYMKIQVWPDGKLEFAQAYDGSYASGYDAYLSGAVEVGYYIHVVAKHQKDVGAWLYLNCSIIASDTAKTGVTPDINTPVRVGGWGPTYYLDGEIALVRVYTDLLTDEEVLDNFYGRVTKDGLVLYLHGDDATETTWPDRSGYGNDGTVYGATPVTIKQSPLRSLEPVRTLAPVR